MPVPSLAQYYIAVPVPSLVPLYILPLVSLFGSIRFLNILVKIPCTCFEFIYFCEWENELILDSQDRLFAGLYAFTSDFQCPKQGQKYYCSIDFYSSDSWLLKDKPLKIILSCFLNSFFERVRDELERKLSTMDFLLRLITVVLCVQ